MRIENDILIDLYRRMLKIRYAEETIAERYHEWQIRCPTHLSIGQEAIAAGVCAALAVDDFVVSTHRCHAHYLAKGGNLNRMIAELYGKSTGCSAGKGGSMHLIDKSVGFMGSTAIVGNTIPLGVGLGLSIQLKSENRVSCVFFGDGAIEEGVLYESINFAVLRHLPVLFVCENNLYSVYSPLEVRQPKRRKIHEMISSLGIEVCHCDGNNVLEVYQNTIAAISAIKNGRGPQFIELPTYRWREHCGPNYDNDLGYRSEEEYLQWKKRDPVKHCEELLKTLTGGKLEKIQKETRNQIDDAFKFAEDSPFPKEEETFTQVFA